MFRDVLFVNDRKSANATALSPNYWSPSDLKYIGAFTYFGQKTDANQRRWKIPFPPQLQR